MHTIAFMFLYMWSLSCGAVLSYNMLGGDRMIVYKIDILKELKEKGYTSYVLREKKIIPEGTMQRLRRKDLISLQTLDVICRLLELQPGDIIEYIPDQENEEDQ